MRSSRGAHHCFLSLDREIWRERYGGRERRGGGVTLGPKIWRDRGSSKFQSSILVQAEPAVVFGDSSRTSKSVVDIVLVFDMRATRSTSHRPSGVVSLSTTPSSQPSDCGKTPVFAYTLLFFRGYR